jgi:hypothetical protein
LLRCAEAKLIALTLSPAPEGFARWSMRLLEEKVVELHIYERNGVANLFMIFAPLEGWRQVKVSDRHTAIDYAHTLKDLSDVHFPDAAKIVLVQDNLNTHKPASLAVAPDPPLEVGSFVPNSDVERDNPSVGNPRDVDLNGRDRFR